MTQPAPGPPIAPPGGDQPKVNAARLWSGGVATAIVAALVVMVGVLLVRGILDIQVLAPNEEGTYGGTSTTRYALIAAAAALAATALLHLLMLATPKPIQFFGWIGTLATVAAALAPLTMNDVLESELATGAINLVAGIAIVTLLTGVGAASIKRPEPPPPYSSYGSYG